MKSVTEFQKINLVKGIETKTTMLAEGKSPEEIIEKLGETRKLDAEKLKFFFSAIEVAEKKNRWLKTSDRWQCGRRRKCSP